jgi:hypothetical protein
MKQTIEQFSQSKMTLAQYVTAHGRNAAADSLGCTPAALTKALKAGRIIFVEAAGHGRFVATETSPFPSRK